MKFHAAFENCLLHTFLKIFRNRNFCVYFVNLERLIPISNVGTFKFEDQRLISQNKLLPSQDIEEKL